MKVGENMPRRRKSKPKKSTQNPPVFSGGLYEFLASRGYYYPREVIKLIEVKLKKRRKAFLLRGIAGVGKTALAILVAQYLNAELIFYQCTQGTSEEDLLYKYIPSEETKSGIKITLGPLPLALLKSQERRVVLLIDEFDKTRPSADALLLDFLQNYRLSLYIEERRQVIQGKPENLVIFLTSNDIREFSEPLLRRLVCITLKPIDVSKVYKILSKRFSKEVALLLTQIYKDSIEAGLRKPATIQELIELGEILEEKPKISFTELVKSIVVKYDDDWEKFKHYVTSREPYDFTSEVEECEEENITEHYKASEKKVEIREHTEEEREQHGVEEILESLISVKKVEEKTIEVAEVKENITRYSKFEDVDRQTYTKVIQTLLPKPTSRPDNFGVFEMLREGSKTFIVAKEPLKPLDAVKLINNSVKGEYYFEGEEYIEDKMVKNLLTSASKINYYTRELIQLFDANGSGEFVIKLELKLVDNGYADIKKYKYRCYVNYKEGRRPTLYDNIETIVKRSIIARFYDKDSGAIDSIDAVKEFIEFTLKLWKAGAVKKLVVEVADAFYNLLWSFNKDSRELTVTFGYKMRRRLEERGYICGYRAFNEDAIAVLQKAIEIAERWRDDE